VRQAVVNWSGAHWNLWLDLTLRLILATLVGGAIGWNRQVTSKAAGLRTHMLVSLGAALFVMIPVSLGTPDAKDALSRSIQGVATGVGFLGAGEIIHYSQSTGKEKVKGLTSAAALWVTAALGMIAAAGLWQITLVGTVLTIMILDFAKRIERAIPQRHDDEE